MMRLTIIQRKEGFVLKKKESAFGIIMLILVILTIFQYWKIICAVLIIFCLCLFLWVILKRKRENSDISLNIQFDNTLHPSAEIRSKNKIKKYSLPVEYVELSTSGDENVCPMCAQFEGKFFPAKRAPKLPSHRSRIHQSIHRQTGRTFSKCPKTPDP